jgi:hypothetical protein
MALTRQSSKRFSTLNTSKSEHTSLIPNVIIFLNLSPFQTDGTATDRLPIPLGEFISERVYGGKLRSCHKIVDYSCIKFIDVRKGNERKQGSSYEVRVRAGSGWCGS